MKATLFAAVIAMIAIPASANSDLMDIWQLSRTSDTRLATANIQEDISRVQVDQGLARLLPNISGNSSYSYSGNDFDIQWDNGSLAYGVTVAQPLYYQNAFYYYDAFKQRAEGRGYSTAAAEQSLMLNVVEQYFNVLRAQDTVKLSQAELRAVERQLEQTEKHYEVGLVAITDVLDAQASHISSKVSLITARGNYENALQSIAVLTGSLPDSVAALPEQIQIPEANMMNIDQWIQTAESQHPALLAEQKNLDFMSLSKKAKSSERLPTVDAVYNYSDDEARGGVATSSFRVGVNIPLYSGGRLSAEILEAGLNLNAAEQGYEQLRRNIELNLRLVHRKLSTDKLNLQALDQAVKSRESALKATEVGYEVGTRNIVEVLNAQRALFASRLQHRMAQYDLIIDQLKIKQAAGTLSESDLSDLNTLLQ